MVSSISFSMLSLSHDPCLPIAWVRTRLFQSLLWIEESLHHLIAKQFRHCRIFEVQEGLGSCFLSEFHPCLKLFYMVVKRLRVPLGAPHLRPQSKEECLGVCKKILFPFEAPSLVVAVLGRCGQNVMDVCWQHSQPLPVVEHEQFGIGTLVQQPTSLVATTTP